MQLLLELPDRGPKARLVLLHLCTEAVRQRSPTVEVADSLSGFMRDTSRALGP
jgi:hypothetical protein